MSTVLDEYVKTLPAIYRRILATFPRIEPARKAGFGLAYQTIYESLRNSDPEAQRISLGEIIEACEKMAGGGAVEIKHKMFVHPTRLGEEIIAEITGVSAPQAVVPEFPRPPVG